LFALPFEREPPLGAPLLRATPAEGSASAPAAAPAWSTRRIVGWSLVATAAVAVSASAELFVSARAAASRIGDSPPELSGTRRQQVRSYDRLAFGAAGVGGLAALAGAAVL